jgi:hypothetical protein
MGAAGARVGGAEAAARGRSSRAAVVGKGRMRLQRGSRLLAAAARVGSECVSEWLSQTTFRPELFRQVCWPLA